MFLEICSKSRNTCNSLKEGRKRNKKRKKRIHENLGTSKPFQIVEMTQVRNESIAILRKLIDSNDQIDKKLTQVHKRTMWSKEPSK